MRKKLGGKRESSREREKKKWKDVDPAFLVSYRWQSLAHNLRKISINGELCTWSENFVHLMGFWRGAFLCWALSLQWNWNRGGTWAWGLINWKNYTSQSNNVSDFNIKKYFNNPSKMRGRYFYVNNNIHKYFFHYTKRNIQWTPRELFPKLKALSSLLFCCCCLSKQENFFLLHNNFVSATTKHLLALICFQLKISSSILPSFIRLIPRVDIVDIIIKRKIK